MSLAPPQTAQTAETPQTPPKATRIALARASAFLLVLGVYQGAWAQDFHKTIALVNLSDSPGASQAAAEARKILIKMPGLLPTSSGDLARALERPLPQGGPDTPVIEKAKAALRSSEAAFAEFKSRVAAAQLGKAQKLLFSVNPSPRATALLAAVSFRLALLHLRANNQGMATGEFQLQHRLAPASNIDSARFPPTVVRAFEQAREQEPTIADATLSISATYDGATLFIDGVPVGHLPLSLKLAAGAHVIAVAAPQFQSIAQTIYLDPRGSQSLRFDLLPRSKVARALALRFSAKKEGLDESSLRAAAASVSRLVGSDEVLLIVGDDAKATLYLQQLDRLSYRSDVASELSQMLALVLPAARPALVDGLAKAKKQLPWYRNPVVITAAATGLSVAIIGILRLSGGDSTQAERRGNPVWEF